MPSPTNPGLPPPNPTDMTISPSRLLLLIAAAWSLAATSCNTLRGVGRDVERAGDGIVNSTR